MILRTDTPLPETFGLSWGMSKERCLQVLDGTVLQQSAEFTLVRVSLAGSLRDVCLQFGGEGTLDRIQIDLYASRSFWQDYTFEEMDGIGREYRARYWHMVNCYRSILGDPRFSGPRGTPGYPEDHLAEHVTYWDTPQGRVQLELEHQDKELPFIVRLAYYSPGTNSTSELLC